VRNFIALVVSVAFFVSFSLVVTGQTSSPTPTPGDQTASGKTRPDSSPPADTNAAAAPETDLLHREELTGDWGGTRGRWKEKGVELEFKLTQFYQGVAAGGLETGSEYNGKFETNFKFDFGKLWGWNFWSAQIKTETRFGGPSVEGTGSISPVNIAAVTPGEDGGVFSITSFNVTKMWPIDLPKGELIAVSVGRFNTLDLVDEDFFAGAGTERFLHTSLNGGLAVAREIPLVTNGGIFAYVRKGEPFFTFAVLDPNSHERDLGLGDLFADGITLSPSLNINEKYWGRSAKHTFSGALSTKEVTPFDEIRQIILPGPPTNPLRKEGPSWSLTYTFRQYLVERGKRDGWGLFVQAAVANEETSPVTSLFVVGLGGNGLFKSRRRDEFGISYAYSGISEELIDALDPITIGRLRGEHLFETFYNVYITPWLRLTGDLQIISPVRPRADTAVVPGVRLEVIF